MTELMQTLYDYAARSLFPGLLTGDEYRGEQVLAEQRARAVLDALPETARKQFRELQDSQNACADMELEAMFQAALAVARELY
ncbi:MAG: hypothetical protein RR288_00030 [Oscillibacter sp.]